MLRSKKSVRPRAKLKQHNNQDTRVTVDSRSSPGKKGKGELWKATLREVRSGLAELGGNCSLQLFSSLKKSGVAEAERILAAWLGWKAEADPTHSGSAGSATGSDMRAAGCVGEKLEIDTPGKKKPPAKGGPGARHALRE